MNAATVQLIINIILLIVLIIGFCVGTVRGAQKQGVRSIYFVVLLIVFLLFSPLISAALMNVQINGQSLSALIENQITSNPEVSNMLDANPAMVELTNKLPVIVINLGVVFALVLLALLISWIAYLITKHVHLNKYKREAKRLKENPPEQPQEEKIYTVKDGKPVVIEKKPEKSKRYRWLGGVLGAVSGFIIMFALLLPFTGVTRTAMTYIDFSTSAEVVEKNSTESDFEYAEISKMLKEVLGDEVVDIMRGINDSAFIKVSSIGDVDLKLFDTISTVKVNGEKITLRNEVKAVADVTETVFYVKNTIPTNEDGSIDFNSMSWQDLDFDRLEETVNSLFSSGIIRSVGSDLVNNILTDDFVDKNFTREMFGDVSNYEYEKYVQYIKEVFNQISTAYKADTEKTIDQIKNDILSFIGVAKAIVYSGMADYLSNIENYEYGINPATNKQQTEFDVIVECLEGKNVRSLSDGTNEYHDYLQDITDSIFRSTTLKGVLVAGVNIGIDFLKEELATLLANQMNKVAPKDVTETTLEEDKFDMSLIKFSTVTQDNINWNNVSNSLKNFITTSIEIYQFVQNVAEPVISNETLTDKEKVKTITSNSGFSTCLTNIGDIFDGIIGSPLFQVVQEGTVETTKSLVNEAIDNFDKLDEVNKYVDLKELKNLSWKNQFSALSDLIVFVAPIVTDELENVNFSQLNYAKLQSATSKSFDSALFKAIKTDWIKEEVNYNNFNETEKSVYDAIFTPSVTRVSDLKPLAMSVVNFVSEVGASGVVDIIVDLSDSNDKPDEYVAAQDYKMFDILCAKDALTNETELQKILDLAVENDSIKKVLLILLNDYLIPKFDHESGEIGTVTVTTDSELWKEFTTKLDAFANIIMQTMRNSNCYNYVDEKPIEHLILVFVNDEFAGDEGTAAQIGKAFDELLACGLFNNEDEESVLKNMLEKYFAMGEQFVYDPTIENFWENELALISTLINDVKDVRVGTEGNDCMWITTLINQTDAELVAEGFNKLTNEQLDSIAYFCKNTVLLSNMTNEMMFNMANNIHKNLQALSGVEQSDLENIEDCASESDKIVEILKIINKMAKLEITCFEDLIADEVGKVELVNLLSTLQTNYDEDYIFAETYECLFDYVSTNYGALPTVNGKTLTTIVWQDVIDELASLAE